VASPHEAPVQARRDIVLATLNAKFCHPAFGLRYLLANLGDLRSRAGLLEFDLNQRPLEIAERVLALQPRIVGLGVYIWNVSLTSEVVAVLKRLRPDLLVVLGGAEVSYETDSQPIVRLADYTVAGEADLAFPALCRALLAGDRPSGKIIAAPPPDLARLALPYAEYDARDLTQRLVYVEASRGCPFECEFCLSSLDIPVRQFPLPAFLDAMNDLLQRGARRFKFVDRTFNLNLNLCKEVLEFFRSRLMPALFLHFEMVPDRLPPPVRELARLFPPGTLQFEVGIQTFNPEVARRVHRRQDPAMNEDNLRFLRQHTGVHLHTDLILGLPGEDLASMAAGFDRLLALAPHEIQVGILKRLRGTSIGRHDSEWQMVYSPLPPYEILQNRLVDFPTMQRLRRFARFWDLIGNRGEFALTLPLLWAGGKSPFAAFLALSDWLYANTGQQHAIALPRLVNLLFTYLTGVQGQDAHTVADKLARDYQRPGRREPPEYLRPCLPGARGSAETRGAMFTPGGRGTPSVPESNTPPASSGSPGPPIPTGGP
jgi:radical SAM superfamily enzyme YgiQ (UPF0313 family)